MQRLHRHRQEQYIIQYKVKIKLNNTVLIKRGGYTNASKKRKRSTNRRLIDRDRKKERIKEGNRKKEKRRSLLQNDNSL